MTQVSVNQSSEGEAVGMSDDLGADAAALDVDPVLGIAKNTWIKIAVIVALMAALFRFNLLRLWDKTNPFYGETNWGHAIAVPLIGLYYLYVNRQELVHPKLKMLSAQGRTAWTIAMVEFVLAMNMLLVSVFAPEFQYLNALLLAMAGVGAGAGALLWLGRDKASRYAAQGSSVKFAQNTTLDYAAPKVGPTRVQMISEIVSGTSAGWFGGFLMVFGIALFAYGIYPGQNDFVKDFGMLVTLLGITIMMAGWARMRIAWFPVVFLVCAIPWPGLIYSRVASPLQRLAADVAVWTLQITGVESSASGTKILISGFNNAPRTLNVAEACAGLRSLMTFISVGAAVAFLSARPLWQKFVITLSAIPIAIFCNVMRISGQGLLDHYVSQQLSESFAHQFVGMIMLIPAFVLILLVGWALDKLFLEEVDRHKRVAPTIIRQQQQAAVAPVAVAAASGRSLASSKAAAQPATAPVQTKKSPPTVTPPPSARLATRTPAPRSAAAPAPAAKTPAAAPVAKPTAAAPAVASAPVAKPAVKPAGEAVKSGRAT